MAIRGLASGITSALRTKRNAAVEGRTLKDVVDLVASRHGLTIVGAIDAMTEEGIVENARTVGETLLAPGLAHLAAKHPMIGDVRGLGVFWALDLVTDRETREPVSSAVVNALKGELMQRGLLPFSADNRIHVVPPCTVSADEVARALAIYDEAFTAVE